MSNNRVDRWQYLVNTAFYLDEVSPQDAIVEARTLLSGVLEVFPRGLNPIDDFEGYAVRRLAASILRILTAKEPETRSGPHAV